jgi:uncharacterized protein YqjF (DUF2071 family)
LLLGDWLEVVMIHLEVEPRALQAATPYRLHLWKGRAFVTLVAFTLRGMRSRVGGRLGRMLFRPLATHCFLNVRTYVQHEGETGIHFLAEWLDSALAVKLGPPLFGLPYRLGRIAYENEADRKEWTGKVEDAQTGAALEYRADAEIGAPAFAPCAAGTLDEWLMERYTAFNGVRGRRRFFRVRHEPWPQVPVTVELKRRSLLSREWPFLGEARLIGANYSPGLRDVWMGWPHALQLMKSSTSNWAESTRSSIVSG